MKIINKSLEVLVGITALILAVAPLCHADIKSNYGTTLMLWQDLRNNVFDRNSKSLRDEDTIRGKLSIWGKWDFNQNFGAYLKLANEALYTIESYNPDRRDFQWDELFVQNLFLDIKGSPGFPVDMRIGRQQLSYGDNLLVNDGTPSDRDRTSYFNAVKTVWRLSPNSSLDLVYINDPKTDQFLPTIREGAASGSSFQDHKRLLTPSDEQGFILYSKNKLGNGLNLEPYYIYKREDSIPGTGKTQGTPTLDLHTIGARSVYNVDAWKFTVEFAYQFGEYAGGRERTGYGGTFFVRRRLMDTLWKPEFELGYTYLSGDNTNTADNEGWNPLFSRSDGWSKLYSSTYNQETGLASYWTNLQLYRSVAKLHFSPRANISVSYNYLRANESTNITGNSAAYYSNSGKERGHLAQTRLNFKLTGNIDGYMAYEYFFPSDFYKMKASASIMIFRLNFKLGTDKGKMNGDSE